jgi:hypothetical protein
MFEKKSLKMSITAKSSVKLNDAANAGREFVNEPPSFFNAKLFVDNIK